MKSFSSQTNFLHKFYEYVYNTTCKFAWRSSQLVIAKVPKELENIRDQKLLFDSIGKKLGVKQWQDWLQIRQSDVEENGGRGILWNFYRKKLKVALMTLYPEHPWPWSDVILKWKKPTNYWANRKFMDKVFEELKFKHWTDWYKVGYRDIRKLGGSAMIGFYYNDSISRAVMDIYPEYKFIPWMFERVPGGYWKNVDNVREAMTHFAKTHGLVEYEDWYCISDSHLRAAGLKSLTDRNGGKIETLKKCFPQFKWDNNYKVLPSKVQVLIFRFTERLLPNIQMHMNYPTGEKEHRRSIELDVYLPSIKLAIEYQGEQHFEEHFAYGNPDGLQHRDQRKKIWCEENGITLITIPYWWDRTYSSFQATIHKARPDVVPDTGSIFSINSLRILAEGQPIPEERPEKFIKN